MSSNTPFLRSFLSESEHQYLIDQIRSLLKDEPHVELTNASHENWQDHTGTTKGIIALPLSVLPFQMPEGWIKSSLLKRYAPGYSIKFIDIGNDASPVKRLRGNLNVYFEDEDLREQCLHQFNNWTSVNDRKDANAELIRTADKDNTSGFTYFDFDPIEIVPEPASGIICLVCRHDNGESKRWGRQLMDRETGMCSNLERELVQIQAEQRPEAELFAFSRKTDSGYETAAALHINGQWARTLETISSTAGAAQMIWNELSSQLD